MTTASEVHGTEPWTATDATFGARLALVRQHMQWGNLKEAAVACGIPVESWRTWERDNVLPRRYLDICAQIARATGCDYGWLVNRLPSGTSTPAKMRAKLAAITGLGLSHQPSLPLLHTVQNTHNVQTGVS